jgi:drug/metabolite transporter (DMT)-like permease
MLRRRRASPFTLDSPVDIVETDELPTGPLSGVPSPVRRSNSHHRKLSNSLLNMGTLQRKRSASSPRDIGDIFFRAEMDFLSDVFDDSSDTQAVIPLSPIIESTEENDQFNGATRDCTPERVNKVSHEEIKAEEEDEEATTWDIVVTIAFVIVSGCVSSVFFEVLLSIDSSAALLAALFLHLWIIMTSVNNAGEYLLSPKIPLYWHILVVALSFGFILFKSYALEKLTMPVFIACSNLQLAIGLFVGTLIFGKTFSRGQYIGVTAVTVGCVLTAIPRGGASDSLNTDNILPSNMGDLIWGICYILLSLLSISIMIPLGSMLVQNYEANIQEQIFLQHLLSMPLFAMRYKDLEPTLIRVFTPSPNDISIGFGIAIPCTIVLLAGTTVFANVNRHYTLELSLITNPMVSQLVNTAQKTIVLVFSMVYFHAPPYPEWFIWLGVIVQTLGSLYYMRDSFSNQNNAAVTFKPNTSRSRYSLVHWDGSTIDLGLSASDVRHLRSLAKEKTRGKMIRCASDSLMPDVLGKIEGSIDYDDYDDLPLYPTRTTRHTFSATDTIPFQQQAGTRYDKEKMSPCNSPPRSPQQRIKFNKSPVPPSLSKSSSGGTDDGGGEEREAVAVPMTRRFRSVSCDDEDITAARARRVLISEDECD